MEDCPTGILIDLSEPVVKQSLFFSTSSQEEDKENSHPLTDSIEIERSADPERRLSLTLKSSDDIQSRILRDVTEQSLQNSAKKCARPALRLIEDETFDFDLAVSPSVRAENVSKEEDDEVFFGPVCFNERLKQTVIQEEEIPPLSPLNAEQFAFMVKEANYVAYRIKNSKASSGEETSPSVASKQSCSSTEETTPPTRRHNRSGTFTKCQSPLELLPEEVRKVLPVIDDYKKKLPSEVQKFDKKEIGLDTKLQQAESESTHSKGKSNLNGNKSTGSRLKMPSKLQGPKLTNQSLKYSSSCESLDGKENRTCGLETDSNCSIASDGRDLPATRNSHSQDKNVGKIGPPKKSKLLIPGSQMNRSFNLSMNSSFNISSTDKTRVVSKTSRLTAPRTGHNTSIREVTPNYRAPPRTSTSSAVKKSEQKNLVDQKQKSAEGSNRKSPRLKARQESAVNGSTQKAGVPGLKGPITKLSLMKPGDLHKRLHKPTTVTGNGPLKATKPIEQNEAVNDLTDSKQVLRTHSNNCISTPVKQDKCVKRKLLANNFTTPSTSSSSSTSTPMSSRRKSFLPTPKKSSGSLSSIPGSPMTGRGGNGVMSRLSQTSSCSSVSDSPVFNTSINRSAVSSARKSISQNLMEKNDRSPSSFKSRKPKVVYTPQLPQKVQSKWSPIRRHRPISKDEEVIKCTKRKL